MRVNLEEGVRRLALVAGTLGATVSLLWTAVILNRLANAQGLEILQGLFLALLPPVFGFALPWAMVQALGGALAGFFQPGDR
jgi:hypothetical protein